MAWSHAITPENIEICKIIPKPVCSISLESWDQMWQLSEEIFEIGQFFTNLFAFEYHDVITLANLPHAATGPASGGNGLTHSNFVSLWPKYNIYQILAL